MFLPELMVVAVLAENQAKRRLRWGPGVRIPAQEQVSGFRRPCTVAG